jgi:hypothetical protein
MDPSGVVRRVCTRRGEALPDTGCAPGPRSPRSLHRPRLLCCVTRGSRQRPRHDGWTTPLAGAAIDCGRYPSCVRRTRSCARRGHDRDHPISIVRSPDPFVRSPRARSISPHILRALAAATMDTTPYPSCVRHTHSCARRGHDGYHSISIVRSPHPFTRSPQPRSISPHIHHAFAVPIRTLAAGTIDMTPYPSCARRGHDGYHCISILRSPHPFVRSPGPRWISPHIHRAFAVPIRALAGATMDITPYPSCVRRIRSYVRRGHD